MELDTVVLLRFAERMLAVAIGGMAIFLGYRLFALVPHAEGGDGEFSLSKNVRIVVTRVGPGVFFALFGAVAVALSLHSPVRVSSETTAAGAPDSTAAATADGLAPGGTQREFQSFSGAGQPDMDTAREERIDTRRALRREIAFLNTLPRMLDPDLDAVDRTAAELSISRIKLALMKPVWGDPADGWGTPEAFERWLQSPNTNQPPEEIGEAIKYFSYPETGNGP